MLTKALVDIFFLIIDSWLALLPDIDYEVPSTIIANAANLCKAAVYVLPMDTVLAILSLIITLQTFRILVSLIKTLWQLLPLA